MQVIPATVGRAYRWTKARAFNPTQVRGYRMEIKGDRSNPIRYSDVVDLIDGVSTAKYGGNLCAHPDSRPRRPGTGLGFVGRFSVRTAQGPAARITGEGRRIPAACWHAHQDVFRAIFDKYPDAVVYTELATYHGRKSFEEKFPATGYVSVGSRSGGVLRLKSACVCSDE